MFLPHSLIIIVTCVLGGAEQCIKDGTTDRCYQIVDTNITWNEAFNVCKHNGGRLIIIESAEEQNCIAGQMRNRKFTVNGLWIGSGKLHPEAQRMWANGDKFTYQNWAKGEPNGTQAGANENCAEISTTNMKWNDKVCSHTRGYICENTRGTEPCIKDKTSGHCYQLFDTEITWNQAFNWCKRDGGNLVTIESVEEQQFIAGLMLKRIFKAGGLWIGSDKLHPEEQRAWANGEQFSYVNWAKGQPNGPLVDENCAEICTRDSTWNDFPCTELRGYICENSRAAKTYIQDNTTGSWYKLVDAKLTWAEAFNICKSDGGMLMIIETAEEQTFIDDKIQKIRFTTWGLWIGSNKLHLENERTWTNGRNFTYANWAKGEPNSPQVQNCAVIQTSNKMWYDIECNFLRGYICEKTPPVTPGSSQRQVFFISIAVGSASALVLIVGVLLLYCLIQRRKKYNKRNNQVCPSVQQLEMNQAEHVCNRSSDLHDTYCTIDDNFSASNDLTNRNEIH